MKFFSTLLPCLLLALPATVAASQRTADTDGVTDDTAARRYVRRVVIEENTGTGCKFCPRGYAGMERLNQLYGNRFIGLALHQYNSSDAMYIDPNDYAKMGFVGAPDAYINRNGTHIDPLFGGDADGEFLDNIDELMAEELAQECPVGVEVRGEWNEQHTAIIATATIETLTEGATYDVAFVLVADSLRGETVAWKQANVFFNREPTGKYPGLDRFCKGGELGQETITGLWFNDVVIGSSYVKKVNKVEKLEPLTAGVSVSRSYTLALPQTGKIPAALREKDVAVVALVLDNRNTIVNAARHYMSPREEHGPVGIFPTSADVCREPVVVAVYSPDGRRLASPRKGLNILRQSDGVTRKFVRR